MGPKVTVLIPQQGARWGGGAEYHRTDSHQLGEMEIPTDKESFVLGLSSRVS